MRPALALKPFEVVEDMVVGDASRDRCPEKFKKHAPKPKPKKPIRL